MWEVRKIRENHYFIRKTAMEDLDEVIRIYDYGRRIMRQTGNLEQWANNHPARDLVEADIKAGASHVLVKGYEIQAVFYFSIEEEPTYSKIKGDWLNYQPYGVIHRIARREDARGAGAFCLEWCFNQYPNLKIDTHRDNKPMLRLLEKQGFKYCGIIWLKSGDERMAFQKVKRED
jgi:RimJ/RimL family protein N-acetyltransferase